MSLGLTVSRWRADQSGETMLRQVGIVGAQRHAQVGDGEADPDVGRLASGGATRI